MASILKNQKVKLELLANIDLLLMIEKGIVWIKYCMDTQCHKSYLKEILSGLKIHLNMLKIP